MRPDDEVEAMLERARRNESSAPRKHHVVPASYLRRWAEGNLVRVLDVEGRKSYLGAPGSIARRTDFYRVESEDLDPEQLPPLLFETLLSDVEGWGSRGIDAVLTDGTNMSDQTRAEFAWFMAFQLIRGDSLRKEIRWLANEGFKLTYGALSEDGIRSLLQARGTTPTPDEVERTKRLVDDLGKGRVFVEPQDAALVGIAASAAYELGIALLERSWMIGRAPRIMLTSDEPVVPVGGPGMPRGRRAGVATSGVILFPLDPQNILIMMRADLAQYHGYPLDRSQEELPTTELDPIEAVEVAREVAMNATRWVFETPSRDMASHFMLPPIPAAGSVDEVAANSDEGEGGELLLFSRPNRWAALPSQLSPWPVERWWA